MSRRMRRFKQLLQMDDAVAILNAGTNGVLSLVDAEGKPYGVPLSYVYDGEGESECYMMCISLARRHASVEFLTCSLESISWR